MSKRFGRNQKRAMREQISDALDMAKDQKLRRLRTVELLNDRELRVRELEDVVQFTREVLGEFFVTLPVQVKPLRQGVDVYDVPVPGPSSRFQRLDDCAELGSMLLRFEQLEAMQHDVERFAELRGMMHLKFRTPAGLMAYAFNTHSFQGFPRRKVADTIALALRDYMLENPAVLDRLGVK